MEVLVQWQRIQKIKIKTKISKIKIEMKTIIKIKTTIIMKIVDKYYLVLTTKRPYGLFCCLELQTADPFDYCIFYGLNKWQRDYHYCY